MTWQLSLNLAKEKSGTASSEQQEDILRNVVSVAQIIAHLSAF